MSQNNQILRGRRFEMTLGDHGCVDRLVPLVDSVKTTIQTIGAIADPNARPEARLTEFFDPKVHGDCFIHDRLTWQTHSFRHHPKAPSCWRATQQWRAVDDYWEWSLEIGGLDGPEREMQVELVLPHPVFPGGMGSGHSKWNLWLPVAQESLGNDYGLRKVHFSQCLDEKTDVPLPLCTLFHHTDDISAGFSCLLPPDQMWYTDFEIDQRNWLTRVTFKNLGLTKGSTLRLRLWCFEHEGDWRPAMGWIRNKFPALLGPVSGQEKLEGNMAYTVPMIPEKRIRDWSQKMHLRWNELFHFRNFGDYFPAEPFNADHFKTPEHPEWTADGLTYDDLNRYIDMCHKHDVKVMPYFNISECESGIARKSFPESIARFYGDNELICWIYYDRRNHNIIMNGDPEYSWFDAVMSQYEKLLRKCPGIDGLFFDQMCYGWMDTAHFDGVTFFNGKPAYNMGTMYLRALKRMRELFPRPRINGLGNGVTRWQLMEYIDGVMAEGDPLTLARFSMISPERPSVCLAEGEYAFQNALYFGSWLHVSPYYRYPTSDPLPDDALRLFAAYQPLVNFLEGRKMVYDPHPLTVRVDSTSEYKMPLLNQGEYPKANIFRAPWGGYAIVILALPTGMTSGPGPVPLKLKINLPDGPSLKHAVIFGVDYEGYAVESPTVAADKSLELAVPAHGAATMILLTHDLSRLQSLKQWDHLAKMKPRSGSRRT